MSKTWIDTITETPEDKRLFEQERAILEVLELVCLLMSEQGISQAVLAQRMKMSSVEIEWILNGERDMGIRTISDLLFHLNHRFELKGLKETNHGKANAKES